MSVDSQLLIVKLTRLRDLLKAATAVPTADAILTNALVSTGHSEAWAEGTLDASQHREILEAVAGEGRAWMRTAAEALLEDFAPKALFGAAKEKVGGFFKRAGKFVRELFTAGVLAVTGPGPANQTDAIIQETAKQVATQREYLANFQRQIVAEAKPLNGAFVARAEQYGVSVWSAALEVQRQAAVAAGVKLQERRVLGPAEEHCEVCPELAARGWVPIGTLPKLGSTPCIIYCRCHFEFRNEGSAKGLVVSCVWDPILKAYVPCRDERGRFASCGGSGGQAKPKPGVKPAAGSGGGKKPKKPRAPKTPKEPKKPKPAKEPKPPKAPKPPKEPKKPAEKKPPKEAKPPKEKPPAEKPKEPEPSKPDARHPSAKLREDVLAASHSNSEQARIVHQFLAKNQKPAVEQKRHGMDKPELMHSVEIDGLTLHYPPPNARDAADAAKGHFETSEMQLVRQLIESPALPSELTRHTSSLYLTKQANADDAQWKVQYNNPNHVSAATGGYGSVVVYGGVRPTMRVLTHEMGHNLATARYGGISPGVGSRYREVVRGGGEPAPTDYGKTNVSEDFAEGVAEYTHNHQEFSAKWPKRAAVLKKLLEDPNYAG